MSMHRVKIPHFLVCSHGIGVQKINIVISIAVVLYLPYIAGGISSFLFTFVILTTQLDLCYTESLNDPIIWDLSTSSDEMIQSAFSSNFGRLYKWM